VVADDDKARDLVGERTPASAAAEAAVPEQHVEPARDPLDDLLSPQQPEDPAEQLPLGDDAISLVTGLRAVPSEEPEAAPAEQPDEAPVAATEPAPSPEVHDLRGEVTVDLTDTSAAVRAAGPPATADADWIATQASERPTPPAAHPDAAPEPEPWDPPGDEERPRGDEGAGELEDDTREDEAEQTADALFEVPDLQERPGRAARPRGRASVPSWDEIMFGTPKSE
jgi:hypothetical protein